MAFCHRPRRFTTQYSFTLPLALAFYWRSTKTCKTPLTSALVPFSCFWFCSGSTRTCRSKSVSAVWRPGSGRACTRPMAVTWSSHLYPSYHLRRPVDFVLVIDPKCLRICHFRAYLASFGRSWCPRLVVECIWSCSCWHGNLTDFGWRVSDRWQSWA